MYITQEEFNKGFVRMMDSMRTETDRMGESNCGGVKCAGCFLNELCFTCGETASNSFTIMQIVWDWNQAHPVVTYGTKYKEVFGFDNQIIDCYKPPKTKCPYEMNGKKCSDCNCKFYKDAEYHAPESVTHE